MASCDQSKLSREMTAAGTRLQAVYLDFPPCLAVQLRAGKEVTIHAHRTMDPGEIGRATGMCRRACSGVR